MAKKLPGTLGAGAETGIVGNTGPDLSALAALIPLLLLAPLLLAATAPAAPAPVAPAPAPVASTTTCVLQCPATYMMLADTTISPNCYLGSGLSTVVWQEALANCLQTPGAYLWRPNTIQEADAVRTKLGIGEGTDVWTGANDLQNEGMFSFIVENSGFPFPVVPFGTGTGNAAGNDCVAIQKPATNVYQWTVSQCNTNNRYVCEVTPRCQ
ncbi:unnamed protein product [Mytilus coruscus]|uniref:C-type lectin domain-containing protein n=1 Tax=Mytilus coruscus TaxID=42192 RepID=A0A6J8EM61_MYTCO|nr:unnamed protein product [Mytilus coruscus]